jgi:hypothetical protein
MTAGDDTPLTQVRPAEDAEADLVVGRYALYGVIDAGGLATVHYGRLIGPGGFSRVVAIKRLRPEFARDPDFVVMFMDEARVASRVRHANVVPILDVVSSDRELFLVMDYVPGETLARLLAAARQRRERVPPEIVCAVMSGVLDGLQAAHEATGPDGAPLGIVHRDVSPQNVMVGSDGIPRVLDFGVAKAVVRLQTTRGIHLKGKLAYMAPEQIRDGSATPRSDLYAAAVMTWEALAGRRLFWSEDHAAIAERVLIGLVDPPSKYQPTVSEGLDAFVKQGLAGSPDLRFASARDMARALQGCVAPAPPSAVADWVEHLAHERLAVRKAETERIERAATGQTDARVLLCRIASGQARSRQRFYFVAGLLLTGAIAVGWRASLGGKETKPSENTAAGPSASAPARALPELACAADSQSLPANTGDRAPSPLLAPPAAPRASHRRAPTRSDDCSIPFTFDPSGLRIYKRHCL